MQVTREIDERAIEAGAAVLANSPLIDAPKLPAPCWHGLARAVIEAFLDTTIPKQDE